MCCERSDEYGWNHGNTCDRTDEIVRTAAYARVSGDSEDQLNSFAALIRYYTELLSSSTDAVFVDMYADKGITGTSACPYRYTTDTLPFRCVENKGEKEKYYVSETHPAIISRETFNSVQRLIEKKGAVRRGKPTSSYAMSKKIYCGKCGTLYKRKERGNSVFWVCRRHDESADNCPSRQIRKTEFQTTFVRLWNKLRAHYKVILTPMLRQLEALTEKEHSGNIPLASLRKEIADIKQQIHLMTVLNSQGTLDSAYFKERTRELDRKLLAAQNQFHGKETR